MAKRRSRYIYIYAYIYIYIYIYINIYALTGNSPILVFSFNICGAFCIVLMVPQILMLAKICDVFHVFRPLTDI